MNNEQTSINKVNIETQNTPEKGPLSFLTGSLTSFLLCIFSYFISNKIAIYFSLHKPSNSSEIVQSISSSINTLIIGLSFLLTFSFAFIGFGLFIVVFVATMPSIPNLCAIEIVSLISSSRASGESFSRYGFSPPFFDRTLLHDFSIDSR